MRDLRGVIIRLMPLYTAAEQNVSDSSVIKTGIRSAAV